MTTFLLVLSLVVAAVNASWFYHERQWSRGVSVLFWLVLAMFALERHPWQVPTMIGLLIVRAGLMIHERRKGEGAQPKAESD